jgi:hypothetical protein
MDIYASISNYITKMVTAGDAQTSGGAAKMKMLLMDRDTVWTASELHPRRD